MESSKVQDLVVRSMRTTGGRWQKVPAFGDRYNVVSSSGKLVAQCLEQGDAEFLIQARQVCVETPIVEVTC